MPAPSKNTNRRHWIAEWAFNFLLLIFVTGNVAQPFVVPTGSMESTVLVGDHIVVDKVAYAPAGRISSTFMPYEEVRRGDIIVFRYPLDLKLTYVKRVIGVPGDRFHFEAKQLWLNGHAVEEPYKQLMPSRQNPYVDNFPAMAGTAPIMPEGDAMLRDYVREGELIVPPGQYLAMGDNRDNSEDSRFWGFVPRKNIVGKPVFIWWSFDAPTEMLNTGIPTPGYGWFLATRFFSNTRWERTLRLVRPYPIS